MSIMDRYDCVLFDIDGVLLRGGEAIPEAAGAVRRVREAGRPVAFVTNNSTRTPEAVARMLAHVGIVGTREEVVTSSVATAELLAGGGVRRAFALGEEGVRAALAAASIDLVDGSASVAPVDAVVVGLDLGLTYDRLRVASNLVRGGARFVATNTDATFPAAEGLTPGAGAVVAAVAVAAGAEPEVVGKPHAPLFLSARARCGGSHPLVVGDRLDTDVAGAAALGWDSMLVLTGVTTRDDLRHVATAPSFVVDDLASLA